MKGKYGNSVTVEITGTQAVVRFDRGVNRNAIDQDTLLALTHVARDLAESLAVHTVLLTGAADIFSAGIDLKDPGNGKRTIPSCWCGATSRSAAPASAACGKNSPS